MGAAGDRAARNDYFTPLAAPIIYVFFLAVLAIVLLARRASLQQPRALAYTFIVRLKDVVDGPVSPAEHAEMLREVTALEDTDRPDLRVLAQQLRPVVEDAPVGPPDRSSPRSPKWSVRCSRGGCTGWC